MKRIISIILLSASLFAGNLEVDGGLSVTGEINANNQAIKNVGLPTSLTDAINGNVLQDALRDNGEYEYTILLVKITYYDTYNLTSSKWYNLDDPSSGGGNDGYSISTFTGEYTSLLNQGWLLSDVTYGGSDSSFWIFKRPI
tara:strand:- start:905 stop:1330 length:426 start_codon:yes stop_codon:yes gene_type:complete